MKDFANLLPAIRSNVRFRRLCAWVWSVGRVDRRYMERVLLPAFASISPERVLSVGTRFYCAHYGEHFCNGKSEYWTMDVDPRAGRDYGSPGRHIIGSVLDAAQHFKSIEFDLILLNGVLGWGVDLPRDQREALASLRKVSRLGSILLIGWDVGHIATEVLSIAEANGFKHGGVLGLPHRTDFRGSKHVYDLFHAV